MYVDGKCGARKWARERARARRPCLRCVFFSPCDWRWSLYSFGDRKRNTTLHKHHIILSPYLWAEEIWYTNDGRHSACERFMSNSKLNWHFKMKKAGSDFEWRRLSAFVSVFMNLSLPFQHHFRPGFKPVIHALLSPRWHKCTSFRPAYGAAD